MKDDLKVKNIKKPNAKVRMVRFDYHSANASIKTNRFSKTDIEMNDYRDLIVLVEFLIKILCMQIESGIIAQF